MRRFVVLSLGLVFLLGLGVLAPATHAQTTASPTINVTPTTVAVGGTATVQGSRFTPNNYVFAYWQRPDGTTNGVYGFTDANGNLSFTLGFDPSHGTGTEYISAYDYGTGRWAPFVSVTVTSGAPPPTTMALSASPNPVKAGSTTSVTGTGFSHANYVYVQWTRPDGTMGATFVYTDSTGAFSFTLGFLTSHGCGTETLQAYDYGTATWSPPYTITVTC
jgi:hypothetical protein